MHHTGLNGPHGSFVSGHDLSCSVADPYHFDMDTDPDPGCEKIRYGSGSRVNFATDPNPGKNDTDPNPGKNDTDPDPAKKKYDPAPGKSLKSDEKSS